MPRCIAFVHGGGQGSWIWDQVIAAVNQLSGGSVRCVALDVPGCGTKRGRETATMAFSDISLELIADIEGENLSDVVLVGHSQAGMVLPQMAEIAPQLFSRIVFVSCSMPLPGKSTLEQMGKGLQGSNADEVGWPLDPATSSIEDRYRVMFCNDMTPVQADRFLAKMGSDMWPPVSYSHCDWRTDHLADFPVSYVKCLADRSLPPAWQDRFAKRLHADQVLTINAGHQVMNSQPLELAKLLLADAAA